MLKVITYSKVHRVAVLHSSDRELHGTRHITRCHGGTTMRTTEQGQCEDDVCLYASERREKQYHQQQHQITIPRSIPTTQAIAFNAIMI